MLLARRLSLRPSDPQRRALAQTAGAARWVWNWGLRRKIESYKLTGKSLSAMDLHKELVQLKKTPIEAGGVPWLYEVSSRAAQEALRDLDVAYKNAFRRWKAGEKPGFPKFKAKRPGEGAFRLYGTIRVDGGHLQLPVLGSIRIAPGDRGYAKDGAYTSVSLVQEHGEWFASVRIERPDVAPAPVEELPIIGIDLGVRKLATIASIGAEKIEIETVPNRKALLRNRRRLREAQKAVSRRKKGSGRRKRAVKRLGKTHLRVKNLRKDATHKFTTMIAEAYRVVAVEDLSIKNMTKAAKGRGRAAKAGLNRSLLDASLREVLRQITYKLQLKGGRLVKVDPSYTSQRCHKCGVFTNCGSKEDFTCAACGLVVDRDENAARNILSLARGEIVAASWSETINARGEVVRRYSLRAIAQTSLKREQKASSCG